MAFSYGRPRFRRFGRCWKLIFLLSRVEVEVFGAENLALGDLGVVLGPEAEELLLVPCPKTLNPKL